MIKRYAIRIQDRNGFERRASISNSIVLGRHSQCDVVLPDEMVSRMHLKVEIKGSHYWAEDLGSSHGTFKDGEKIKRIQWEPGAVLVIADGAYRLMLVPEKISASESNVHAILSTARHIASEFDLEHLLQRSLDHLLRLSCQDRGLIFVEVGGKLEPAARRILVQDPGSETHISTSAIEHVFETGEPIWVSDVENAEELRHQKSVRDLQLKSIYCLPMSVKSKNIGVVYLDSRHFCQDPIDRNVFEAIVELCTIAIDRARTLEEKQSNRLLATVGSVAADIVHDFKNALFLIGGHAEILSNICHESDAQRHLEQIQASVDRLTAMSSEILGLVRMKAVRITSVDFVRFIKAEIAKWRPKAKKDNVKISGKGPACIACIDASKLVIALDNLIVNAIEAIVGAEREGEIKLSWEPKAKGVKIKVCDNGKGIPKRAIKKIFEPFFSYGKENGTGLGLPTVKNIIEMHDGTISIESQVGRGTEVTIFLPHSKDLMPAAFSHSYDGLGEEYMSGDDE